MSVTLKVTNLHGDESVFRRTPLRAAALAAAALVAVVGCSSPSDVPAPPAAPANQFSAAIDKARNASAKVDAQTRGKVRALDAAAAD